MGVALVDLRLHQPVVRHTQAAPGSARNPLSHIIASDSLSIEIDGASQAQHTLPLPKLRYARTKCGIDVLRRCRSQQSMWVLKLITVSVLVARVLS